MEYLLYLLVLTIIASIFQLSRNLRTVSFRLELAPAKRKEAFQVGSPDKKFESTCELDVPHRQLFGGVGRDKAKLRRSGRRHNNGIH